MLLLLLLLLQATISNNPQFIGHPHYSIPHRQLPSSSHKPTYYVVYIDTNLPPPSISHVLVHLHLNT